MKWKHLLILQQGCCSVLSLLVVAFLLLSCGSSNISIRYGQDTSMTRLAHTKTGQSYKSITVAQQEENWEGNISTYVFDTGEREFSTNSIGITYRPTKEWGWFYIDGGLGLRYTTKDKDNPWLADSNILGEISGGFGIKKEFETWELKAGYMLEHLSVPGRHDKGINMNSFKMEVLF